MFGRTNIRPVKNGLNARRWFRGSGPLKQSQHNLFAAGGGGGGDGGGGGREGGGRRLGSRLRGHGLWESPMPTRGTSLNTAVICDVATSSQRQCHHKSPTP